MVASNENFLLVPYQKETAKRRVPNTNNHSSIKERKQLLRRPRPPNISAERQNYGRSLSPHACLSSSESYQFDRLSPLPPVEGYRDQSLTNLSPTPSVVPSLVSPPPAETIFRKPLYYVFDPATRKHHGVMPPFITKNDTRYILDPVLGPKSACSGDVDSTYKHLIRPYKSRGPDPLPMREPRHYPEVVLDYADFTDDQPYIEPPAFTLNNFMIDLSKVHRIPIMHVRKAMFSSHNYVKLTKIMSENIRQKCKALTTITMTPEEKNIPESEQRVPQQQLFIEMACMIKEHVREIMHQEVKSIIKPLPKYQPSYKPGSAPHTEIILYQDETPDRAERKMSKIQRTELICNDAIVHAPRSSYFQGSARSASPFNTGTRISLSELAILESLIKGGTDLSLKAHFITEMPDISPLYCTLTSLNLSFNDFTELPEEVMDLENLEQLKLRNNPITSLPYDIGRLQKLKVLSLPFCLLSELPSSLYSLRQLYHLDLAYNRFSSLSNEFSRLISLGELNLEGNQLDGLPRNMMKLNIEHITVKNNAMHPLFWKEHMKSSPLTLRDTAALVAYQHKLHRNVGKLPESIQTIMFSFVKCDCCDGPMYGPGLKIIRPVPCIFSINNLPFIFYSCSPLCLQSFMKKSDSLSEMLYGLRSSRANEG